MVLSTLNDIYKATIIFIYRFLLLQRIRSLPFNFISSELILMHRFIYFIAFFSLITTVTVSAQAKLYPLSGNIEQKKQAALQQNNRISQLRAMFPEMDDIESRGPGGNWDCPDPDPNSYYILSGNSDTLWIDADSIAIGGGRFEILACHNLGNAFRRDDTSTFIGYIPDNGIDLAFDTLCVEICDSGNVHCDTLVYPIILHRQGTLTVMAPVTLPTESFISVSVDTLQLPGGYRCRKIECHEELLGTVTPVFNSILYESNRFAGLDTVCFIVCDPYQVCDTFRIPFRIVGDTINLPFMDDFSYPGPYPARTMWLDDNVYINTTLSSDPPSVGFATFDGLDKSGSPYGSGTGTADLLTSAYLNLGVIPANDTAWISFYLEPKGLTYRPNEDDYLSVQFKNAAGSWVEQVAVFGESDVPLDSVPPFRYYALPITGQFLYKGFQFRFLEFGNLAGIYGAWHLDYVRVSGESLVDSTFEDIAFTNIPAPILKNMTSMPWRHIEGIESQELREDLDVQLYSHFGFTNNIVDSRVSMKEQQTNTPLFNPPFVLYTGNIESTQRLDLDIPIANFGDYLAVMQGSFNEDDELLKFTMEYSYAVSSSQAQLPAVLRNDTVRQTTVFADYMSYDDGSAELAVAANGLGTQMALKYHAFVADTLRAVRFHFPYITGANPNQLFNLKVWVGELDDEAEYQAVFRKPYYPDLSWDTLQAFTTYLLTDDLIDSILTPVALPAGTDFYIGWQQASGGDSALPVGYDVNNPGAGQHLYQNTGAGWAAVELPIGGATMLRPVFSPAQNSQTASTGNLPVSSAQISLFPNPVKDLLSIRLEDNDYEHWKMKVYHLSGAVVTQGVLSPELNVSSLVNGIYFLEVVNVRTGTRVMEKFVVQR